MRHTPPVSRRVTCIVGEDEDPDTICTSTVRRATVQLPNTATFGELLERARSQRLERLGAEDPIYGCEGELDVSLREAWVRDGCRVNHRFHVGRAVVVHLLTGGRDASLSCVMGPGDTIGDVKKVRTNYCFLLHRKTNVRTMCLYVLSEEFGRLGAVHCFYHEFAANPAGHRNMDSAS